MTHVRHFRQFLEGLVQPLRDSVGRINTIVGNIIPNLEQVQACLRC